MIRIGLTRGELKMMLEDGTPQVWREALIEIEVFRED